MAWTKNEMSKWITDNVNLTLDQMATGDAKRWVLLAENDTHKFLKLAEQGFRFRREQHNLAPPASKREITAFLLEFRCKIQIASDQIAGLPPVALFELGGEPFIGSAAFREATFRYGSKGGRA